MGADRWSHERRTELGRISTGQVDRGSPFAGRGGRASRRQSFDGVPAPRGGRVRGRRPSLRPLPPGYEPTAAGQEMIALAATMAESVLEFERRVAGRDVKPTGDLTVTTPEAIGQH